jgi:hypothetical protein
MHVSEYVCTYISAQASCATSVMLSCYACHACPPRSHIQQAESTIPTQASQHRKACASALWAPHAVCMHVHVCFCLHNTYKSAKFSHACIQESHSCSSHTLLHIARPHIHSHRIRDYTRILLTAVQAAIKGLYLVDVRVQPFTRVVGLIFRDDPDVSASISPMLIAKSTSQHRNAGCRASAQPLHAETR